MKRLRVRLPDQEVEVDLAGAPRLPVGRPGCLLAHLLEAGVAIPHACGGFASCGTCHLRVVAGAEALGPVGPEEAAALGKARGGRGPGSRLACQCGVADAVEVEVVVEIPGGFLTGLGGNTS